MTRSMPLSTLLPDVAAVPADLVVTGLTMDSRDVRPGDAFFAIGGFGTHGLRFAAQAKEAGAAVVLFEPPAPSDLPAPPPSSTTRTRPTACRCLATASPSPACARAWERWPTSSTAGPRTR